MEMFHEVRKMIREGMAEYRALSQMADVILRRLSDLNHRTVNEFLSGALEGQMMLPQKVELKDMRAIVSDPSLAGTDLASMVPQYKSFSIGFMYRMVQRNVGADYRTLKDEDGRTVSASITIYFTKKFLDALAPFQHRQIFPDQLYNLLSNAFSSFLVHELRHAVDDHRFQDIRGADDRPVFSSLQPRNSIADRFRQRYAGKKPSPDADKEAWLKYHREYLKLPHEVWARFAQVVHDEKFKKETDDPYVLMPDGSKGVTYVMAPLARVLEGLQYMTGWNVIGEKQRRRLIRALSNLWHEEAEWVEENNREVRRRA